MPNKVRLLSRCATVALATILIFVAYAFPSVWRSEQRAAALPPLSLLHFSPDGRYILAQDESSVTVLTVQPFAVLFRIPAESALPAQFTPDSRQIVFVASATRTTSQRILIVRSPPRVERWSVANQARVESTELCLPPCDTEALSPDGHVLACVDFGGTLHLVDVGSGQTIFEKERFGKKFLVGDLNTLENPQREEGDPGAAFIDFSPGGRFVVATPEGPKAHGSPVGFDLEQRKPIKLEGKLRDLDVVFVFAGPTRLVTAKLDLLHPAVTATVIAWPSGKVLLKTKIPGGGFLFQATDPGFILVRPFGQGAFFDPQAKRSAATELRTGKVIISETPALDVVGDHYVTQFADGRVALFERGKPEPEATVRLEAPRGLGRQAEGIR